MKKTIATTLLGLAASLAMAAGAQAQEATLDKIQRSGTLVMGHRDTSIPFSYTTAGVEPMGFAVDLCKHVIDAVKQELNLPDLRIQYQTVTSANRIPLLQNGTIDLECGSTTNTKARQKQVAFGPSYIMVGIGAAVKKKSGIQSLSDLANRTVTSTTGTTALQLLRSHRRTENMQFRELYGKDHSDSFLLLNSDRADAFILDDILLAGLIATSNNPDDFEILEEKLREEPYGIMLRGNDPTFKKLVDATIKDLMTSGEILELYNKWFMSPIPPRGLSLNYPMNEATRKLYESPSDEGV